MRLTNIVGESKTFLATLEKTSILAKINRPVLIIGERGTGKELIAERLHFLSPRWEKPYITVNCATFSDSLLDSELFGHEVGAFTGAATKRLGQFEQAHEGSLFLDELATMNLKVQEKILRVLEYGDYKRLGSDHTRQVDVRVIAATNVNLPERVDLQQFKADLLDRLCFDVIHLPALRERTDDIPILAQHFAIKMSQELKRSQFKGFTQRALVCLSNYDWPGNIRELKNVVERAIYHADSANHKVDTIQLKPFPSLTPKTPPGAGGSSGGFTEQVDLFKQQLLENALQANAHNQKKAAQSLGLTYDQLRGLLRKKYTSPLPNQSH